MNLFFALSFPRKQIIPSCELWCITFKLLLKKSRVFGTQKWCVFLLSQNNHNFYDFLQYVPTYILWWVHYLFSKQNICWFILQQQKQKYVVLRTNKLQRVVNNVFFSISLLVKINKRIFKVKINLNFIARNQNMFHWLLWVHVQQLIRFFLDLKWTWFT
jgi:hypothetical protein